MVVDDPEQAAQLVRDGLSVVLIVDGADVEIDLTGEEPGRLATLVGRNDDPATWEAARAMDEELFPVS